MNAIETNVFLTKAAQLDPRMKRTNPIEQADMAEEWALLLGDVPLLVALEALRKHYRLHAVPIMPAHVVEFAGVADPVESPYRDITAELLSDSKIRVLNEAGVTLEEFEEKQHDIEWLRAKFGMRGELA